MGIGLLLCLVPFVAAADPALRLPLLFGLYALAGTCGGLYLIPITSFIQVRPAATDKGASWARQLPFFHRHSACGPTVSASVIVAALARACGPRHSQLGRCLRVSGCDAWFRAASKP
ncbi:MAG: hypothetical protein ACLSAH_14035 [Bilophila wadsworthia]